MTELKSTSSACLNYTSRYKNINFVPVVIWLTVVNAIYEELKEVKFLRCILEVVYYFRTDKKYLLLRS